MKFTWNLMMLLCEKKISCPVHSILIKIQKAYNFLVNKFNKKQTEKKGNDLKKWPFVIEEK
jgi:hypothetical protein